MPKTDLEETATITLTLVDNLEIVLNQIDDMRNDFAKLSSFPVSIASHIQGLHKIKFTQKNTSRRGQLTSDPVLAVAAMKFYLSFHLFTFFLAAAVLIREIFSLAALLEK